MPTKGKKKSKIPLVRPGYHYTLSGKEVPEASQEAIDDLEKRLRIVNEAIERIQQSTRVTKEVLEKRVTI